jgi:predicted RNA binding protein YcfA (HicA-like mRNA interferase family)
MPHLTTNDAEKLLRQHGFVESAGKKHKFFQHADGRTTHLSRGSKGISVWLLGKMAGQMGMTVKQFLNPPRA